MDTVVGMYKKRANQLTGFYMRETLAFSGLRYIS